MPLENGTVVHNQILGRHVAPSAILIFPRLDADGIISDVEGAVHDQAVPAGLQVDAVAILCKGGIAHLNTVDDHILAHQRMDIPGG